MSASVIDSAKLAEPTVMVGLLAAGAFVLLEQAAPMSAINVSRTAKRLQLRLIRISVPPCLLSDGGATLPRPRLLRGNQVPTVLGLMTCSNSTSGRLAPGAKDRRLPPGVSRCSKRPKPSSAAIEHSATQMAPPATL